MNHHLTLYAYEEDGELIVYRCPVCGSSGAEDTHCPHDPPIADGYEKGLNGWVKRVRVRVPGVGEEPRYTVEQVRAGLLSDGAILDATDAWHRTDGLLDEVLQEVLGAALDHFTQQPAGVGADTFRRSSRETRGVREHPEVSADSDGNQQPQGGGA